MPQATLPVAGTVYNVDYVLGKDGIIGAKTGSTPQAGGCFASARYQQVGSHRILVLGVVLGQDGAPSPLMQALNTSAALLKQAGTNLHTETVSPSNGAYAVVESEWGNKATLSSSNAPSFIGYPGLRVQAQLVDTHISQLPIEQGTDVAKLQVTAGQQSKKYPMTTDTNIKKPNFLWRILHV